MWGWVARKKEPFRQCNAQTIFQRVSDEILLPFVGIFCAVRIDRRSA